MMLTQGCSGLLVAVLMKIGKDVGGAKKLELLLLINNVK
jgi:hypothetical protein